MGDFGKQLGLAIAIGFVVFLCWQLIVFFLPDFWPEKARKGTTVCARFGERLQAFKREKNTRINFWRKNLYLGSSDVEQWRRKVNGLAARCNQRAGRSLL